MANGNLSKIKAAIGLRKVADSNPSTRPSAPVEKELLIVIKGDAVDEMLAIGEQDLQEHFIPMWTHAKPKDILVQFVGTGKKKSAQSKKYSNFSNTNAPGPYRSLSNPTF